MGLYDTVGDNHTQIKCIHHEEPTMKHYPVGTEIPLPDGLYFGYEGWFIVLHGRVNNEGSLFDVRNKWGGQIVIDLDIANPVVGAIKDYYMEDE